MKSQRVLCTLIGLVLGGLSWGDPSVAPVTHGEFQAVNSSGEQTYQATQQVTLEGIVLHNPADMLDPTPDDTILEPFNLGGQWQLFFQGEGDDHGGTAVYMAQLYDNLPWIMPGGGYSNQVFIAELARINAARFSVGDRIRVTGWFLSYKGKNKINEQHSNSLDHDFTVEVLARGVGLPRPEAVSLDELKDDQDRFVFDPARLVGGEYYQGRLIKVEDVNVVDAKDWRPGGTLTVTNGRKTLTVRLGRGNGIYPGAFNLEQPFDVIGILDQDSTDLRDGYQLYVVNYDGNGRILASYEHRMADQLPRSIPIENASFEAPPIDLTGFPVLPYIDGWMEIDRDPLGSTNTGVFANTAADSWDHIVNADGNQLAFLGSEHGNALEQDLTATYRAGCNYRLTVAVGVSARFPPSAETPVDTLELVFYYRDETGPIDIVWQAVKPLGLAGQFLRDFSVDLPTVNPDGPWAGRSIGVAIRAVGMAGGFWVLDNLRLAESSPAVIRR
jgi:hypothetical protein